MNEALHSLCRWRIERYAHLQSDRVLQEFVHRLNERFGHSMEAVILYGSALRMEDLSEGLLDFYVVLNSYASAMGYGVEACANYLLPPNVYYLKLELDGCQYQAKYATVSSTQLSRRVRRSAFHPYFWARFCQPVALLYAANNRAKDRIVDIQAQAIRTFLQTTTAATGLPDSQGNLWLNGFRLTYRTELRAESAGRADIIYQYDATVYDQLQENLFEELQALSNRSWSAGMRPVAKLVWAMRMICGKLLSVLRLTKAVFTFANGVEYIVWKIERHNHIKIELNQRIKDHPLVFGWPLLFKLWRSGHIR